MKKIIFLITTAFSVATFAAPSNTVIVEFDPKEIGSISCVEQIKKDGTVVFKGVITKAEYDAKYSGFWFKDGKSCEFWKKVS